MPHTRRHTWTKSNENEAKEDWGTRRGGERAAGKKEYEIHGVGKAENIREQRLAEEKYEA